MSLVFTDHTLDIERDQFGVPNIKAADDAAMYRGMGYCHATDRGMQMLMMRVLGRGQLSKFLDSSDGSLQVDLFFRRMGWATGDDEEAARIDAPTRALLDAYCAGVNARFDRKLPWELKAAGYKHSPWRVEDCIVVARVISYVSLAQSQGDVERFLVELIQAGVPDELLEELYPGQLAGLDSDLVRKVVLGTRHVPPDLKWASIGRATASNNWVVSGKRSASGKPLLANDPHLEINRLPNVWYELVVEVGDRWGYSATMPGVPGLLIGRTTDLAWGATYTFADTVDSWIEDCKAGTYRRGDAWLPFRVRRETIERKNKQPHEVVFYENDHGTLDGDPHRAGYYLATRWSGAQLGAASLHALTKMWRARSVEEGRELMGALEPAFNWVLADRDGHIGYQMSGAIPKRTRGSGLIPLPGWDPANDWAGFHVVTDLPRVLDPEAGFFVTANNDLNEHGTGATSMSKPITASMGGYRAERIAQLLAEKPTVDAADMQRIQLDLTSLQAEAFMTILRPQLPSTPQGKLLRDWDCRYDAESRGAFLFERFYRELLVEVFGGVFGEAPTRHLLGETGIFTDFFEAFDRVLLADTSAWLRGQDREAVWRRVAERALAVEPQPWRDGQQLVLAHMLFGGKLPRVLGFDRGPITLEGGRSTVHQGQIYRSGGRATSFAPSVRLVTDMARDEVRTTLVGGPSDRRFSRWYISDLERWQRGELKTLGPRTRTDT
jgi:penicillin amidase